MPMRHWRSRHAAHLLGSGGMRSAPCRLRQKYRGTVRRLGGPAASPACHGISQPPHLQTHVPPAVSRPSAAEPSPFVHASGHRAISHFYPKAPRSVRVSEEPWTSSELRPRGELLRTCSSANKLCITAAVARRCRPHQWNARTEVRSPTLGSQARRSHSSTDLHA